jgi:flagellar assembly factor FliW
MMTMAERGQQLSFVEPLPGFADESSYTLSAIDPNGLLSSLRSVRCPEVRFVLTPAATFFPDYHPDLSGVLTGVLGSDDVAVLLVLTLGVGLADATANLRAPIALSPSTGRAVQVVLEDAALRMREPLVAQ